MGESVSGEVPVSQGQCEGVVRLVGEASQSREGENH